MWEEASAPQGALKPQISQSGMANNGLRSVAGWVITQSLLFVQWRHFKG
jgi:hypothetical protein